MIDGIPPSSFGTFGRNLAVRVNALARQIGITQTEAIGLRALVVTSDGDGEETTTNGKAGQFVTLTNGALQETQIEFWEGGVDGADWKSIHAAAAFTFEPESTGRLRLAHKPLARDAKATMGLLAAKHEHEPAAGRTVPGARTSFVILAIFKPRNEPFAPRELSSSPILQDSFVTPGDLKFLGVSASRRKDNKPMVPYSNR